MSTSVIRTLTQPPRTAARIAAYFLMPPATPRARKKRTNHFTATSPQDAARQMIEWLTAHGGAENGAYLVIDEDQDDAEPIVVEAADA